MLKLSRRTDRVMTNREKALERDHYTCLECGATSDTIHHIVSRRYDGAEDVRNLACLCARCHLYENGGAHRHSKKVEHIALLKRLYAYDYTDLGGLWVGLEREANYLAG